jgi:hypothetical protein
MNGILDNLLVGLVLAASAGYVITSLGPRGLKARALVVASRGLRLLPAALRLHGLAEKLALASAAKSAGGCGGCDNCGSEHAASQTPGAEVSVPLTKIGRRTQS